MKKFRLISLLLALTLVGCNAKGNNSNPGQKDDPSQTDTDPSGEGNKNIPVSSISLNPTSLTLTEGDKSNLEVTVQPENATYEKIEWSTGDERVASVHDGEVSANTKGETTITASIGDKTATCAVTVNAKPVVDPDDFISTVKLSAHSDFQTFENTTFLQDKISLVTLDYVEDGDTVHFKEGKNSLTIRMAYIDTPSDIESWGHEAMSSTRALMAQAKTIVITNKSLSSTGSVDLDSTGERYVGFIWYSRKENATINDLRCLNLDLVNEGYSKSFSKSGDLLYDQFSYCENVAKEAKKNIWSDPVIDPTTDYGYNHYNGYYGELTWTNGEDLKEKLHNIISKDVNYIRYDSSPANWETNIDADHSYSDLDMLDIVYSTIDVSKDNSQKGWQREHAYVASLMTGFSTSAAVTTKQGRAVDFHNLFAASASGNQSRSDKNFGYADPNATGYQETEGYKSDSKTFEPNDEDKGRLARAIFYMGVMYSVPEEESVKVTLTYNAEDAAEYGKASQTVYIPVTYKPLTIQEEPVPNANIVSYTNYYYHTTDEISALVTKYGEGEEGYGKYVADTCKYSIGHLSELLEWTNFPVEIQEYQHNVSVYSHEHPTQNIAQNNRNPFVDYPGLIDYVYGSKQNQPGDLKYLEPTSYRLALEESKVDHYAIKDVTREYEVGDTFSKDCYTLMGVKNDFTTVEVASSVDTTESYTFKESDVGTKEMTISTDKNAVKTKVTVKQKEESFSYKYVYSGTKADFGDSDYSAGVARTITLAGEKWSATAQHAANISNKNDPLSVQIGNGTTKCAEKFTLVSQREFANVNKIKIVSNAAANKPCTVTIKIGDEEVDSYNITGSSTAHTERVINVSPTLTGLVTIEFSNLNAALFINTIAINEVK